jgi:hypothetical protein
MQAQRPAPRVLFFGDSATRGYGVGREARFATLVEKELDGRPAERWSFEVESTVSDFRRLRSRLDAALERVRPLVLVCQCPVGPACFQARFPWWVRSLIGLQNRLSARTRDTLIASELRAAGEDGRTRHDSLYEGRYLDRVHRRRLSNWPVVGRLWRARASRYPTVEKLSCAGYVERMLDLRERARAAGVREALFIGLLPVADDVCPGYGERAPRWCSELRLALDEDEKGSRFLDVLAPLEHVPRDRLLLEDRVHLSAEGHRAVAQIVTSALEPLLRRAIAD